MARLGMGIMVILFWTGLANGPADASGARDGRASASVARSSSPEADDAFIDRWLADVAACEAGEQYRCAPVLS